MSINKIRPVAYGQDRDGYYRTILSDNGKKKYVKIHQMVATQFLGECPRNKVINHIDGNKHNNSVYNLEYITSIENTRHAWRTGLSSKDKNPNRIKIDIFDNKEKVLYNFSSLEEAHIAIPCLSKRYIQYVRNNKISFNLCLFKKAITGSRQTDYYIECFYNGKLYKIFDNVKSAGTEFNRPPNSVSGAFKAKYPLKFNRYTITFPNVSTIESTQ